jgi:hypothetical protein
MLKQMYSRLTKLQLRKGAVEQVDAEHCQHACRVLCALYVQVVAEAMNCTANIAKGLRKDYKGPAMTLCSGLCSAPWLFTQQHCAMQPICLSAPEHF